MVLALVLFLWRGSSVLAVPPVSRNDAAHGGLHASYSGWLFCRRVVLLLFLVGCLCFMLLKTLGSCIEQWAVVFDSSAVLRCCIALFGILVYSKVALLTWSPSCIEMLAILLVRIGRRGPLSSVVTFDCGSCHLPLPDLACGGCRFGLRFGCTKAGFGLGLPAGLGVERSFASLWAQAGVLYLELVP
ncbi:hypothetical protein Nepgr_006807 [Nepenthes gracilis]|uniref:Uncharacterized protein n=1 Tax=Nepenthes gracilis TaxID=150966 RepID=A0AAD3S6I5_NEPGR|nr:hypothetical protein Nepgr_006807 [Nepenthes gracilis]